MFILWLSISCQKYACQTHIARSETSLKRSKTGALGHFSCGAKCSGAKKKSLLSAIRLLIAPSDVFSALLLYSAVRPNIPFSPLFLTARL